MSSNDNASHDDNSSRHSSQNSSGGRGGSNRGANRGSLINSIPRKKKTIGSMNSRNKRNRLKQDKLTQEASKAEAAANAPHPTFEEDPTWLFLGNAKFDEHLDAQTADRKRYAATLAMLLANKIEVTSNSCVKALAAAWTRHDHDLVETAFLKIRSVFGPNEVVKALEMMDLKRKVQQLEKKHAALCALREKRTTGGEGDKADSNGSGAPRESTLKRLEDRKKNLQALLEPRVGNLTGALCRHVRRWLATFTQEELNHFTLIYAKQKHLWRSLADLVHCHPTKHFPGMDWFTKWVYDEELPVNAEVRIAQALTEANVNDFFAGKGIKQMVPDRSSETATDAETTQDGNQAEIEQIIGLETKLPFRALDKKLVKTLNEESKARIAQNESSVTRVIWWYDTLHCRAVDKIIYARLEGDDDQAGEAGTSATAEEKQKKDTRIRMGYGKLMERLMSMKIKNPPFFQLMMEQAEEKLVRLSLQLPEPIAVLADASSSMDVAIRTASIIASLLAAVTKAADLVFFNHKYWSEPAPKNTYDAMGLAERTRAKGQTSHAAGLWPFYSEKKPLGTIFCVTDEEENTDYENMRFLPMLKKYVELPEVSTPPRLIFISFLRTQHGHSQMVPKIRDAGFKVDQYVFNQNKPDLSKLDHVLGKLQLSTAAGAEEISRRSEQLGGKEDFDAMFTGLNADLAQEGLASA